MTEKLSAIEKQATATIATMDEEGPLSVSAARLVMVNDERKVRRRCLGCRIEFLHDVEDLNPIHHEMPMMDGTTSPCNTIHHLPPSIGRVAAINEDLRSWEGRKISWREKAVPLVRCSNQTCQYFWPMIEPDQDCLVCGTPMKAPEIQK